jgi:chromosome segregation ATPase
MSISAKLDQILSRISGDAALAEKAGKLEAEVVRLNTEHSNLTKELTETKEALGKVSAELEQAKASAISAESAKVEAESKLSAAEATAKELGEKLANPSAQAAEILAKVGVKASDVPKAETKPNGKTATRSEFEAMRHFERNNFIREGGKVTNG